MNHLDNASFLPGTKLQIAWDSHSLGLLKECPRKYQLSIIQGWATRAESVHLTFGILYHSGLEFYDLRRAEGVEHEEAVLQTVHELLKLTTTRTERGFRVWNSDDANKNRFTLIRTVVWYLDQFEHDVLETVILPSGAPGVELSFAFATDLYTNDGQPYLLCGRMDRLVRFQDSVHVLDRKTSKLPLGTDYFKKYSPDNQMSLYAFAAPIIYPEPARGVIVDAAQVLVTFSRFRRGETLRSQDQLDEWYADAKFYIKQNEFFVRQDYWPMNDKSCGNYGGCPFRDICGMRPVIRDSWLKSTYKERTWDPMTTRVDV